MATLLGALVFVAFFSRRSRLSLRFMPRESDANRIRSMRPAWTRAHE